DSGVGGRAHGRRRFRVRGKGGHRLRYEAAARAAGTAGRARDSAVAVHESGRAAAPPRPLGASRDRRAGRVRPMDGPLPRAPSAAARHPPRQTGARGHEGVVITHPDKVLFPDDGITKGELAAYYEAIAPLMLPHIRARPVTMERYPSGIQAKGFFQKDVSKGF